jgi:SAM-dependent methyltransferase
MVVCPRCAGALAPPRYRCPACAFEPESRNGYLAWAPQLAGSSDGFHPEDFSNLAPVEAQHFWFRSRTELILWALRKYAPPTFASLLEIGCGTGFVLSGIAKAFPHARLVGTEVFVEGLEFASRRVGAELMQMDARALPYVDEFDVVSAFDVIEHIDEDELVLENLHRAVRPGGVCLLSVPQHMWLWSPVDEEACHKRRYGVRELESKTRRAGFRIERSTSFVTLLLPAMLLSRTKDRQRGRSGGPESLRVNPLIGRTLEEVLRIERLFIQAGLSLPVGGSRLMVLSKP